jgi:four helix bundle protein
MQGRKHHELRVWQDAVALVKQVYECTKSFPSDERFGLTSQLRRAAVSVPSNIAEGAARRSKREFVQFLTVARGSLAEVETQIIIGPDLGYLLDARPIQKDIENLFGKLGSLIKSQDAHAGE